MTPPQPLPVRRGGSPARLDLDPGRPWEHRVSPDALVVAHWEILCQGELMQLVKCSIDGERPKEVPATLFWAWRDPDGTRHAYKQRLCLTHYAMNVAPLEAHLQGDVLTCPACGIQTETDYKAVYASIFAKGTQPSQMTLPLCANCYYRVCTNAEIGSEQLPDRGVGAEASAPTPSAWESLRALGREPHV